MNLILKATQFAALKHCDQRRKDGKRDGLFTGWYENGQKEVEGTHNNEKQVGKWTFYNEDGTINKVKEY